MAYVLGCVCSHFPVLLIKATGHFTAMRSSLPLSYSLKGNNSELKLEEFALSDFCSGIPLERKQSLMLNHMQKLTESSFPNFQLKLSQNPKIEDDCRGLSCRRGGFFHSLFLVVGLPQVLKVMEHGLDSRFR